MERPPPPHEVCNNSQMASYLPSATQKAIGPGRDSGGSGSPSSHHSVMGLGSVMGRGGGEAPWKRRGTRGHEHVERAGVLCLRLTLQPIFLKSGLTFTLNGGRGSGRKHVAVGGAWNDQWRDRHLCMRYVITPRWHPIYRQPPKRPSDPVVTPAAAALHHHIIPSWGWEASWEEEGWEGSWHRTVCVDQSISTW